MKSVKTLHLTTNDMMKLLKGLLENLFHDLRKLKAVK